MKRLWFQFFLNRRWIAQVWECISSGQVPKWTKGADCKSAALWLPRFEPLPAHQTESVSSGSRVLDGAFDCGNMLLKMVCRRVESLVDGSCREIIEALVGLPGAGVAQW